MSQHEEPRRHFRPGDTPAEKANAVFDRWRGILVVVVPLVVTAFTALGLRIVWKPGTDLDAQQKQIRSLAKADSMFDVRIVQTASELHLHRQAEADAREALQADVRKLLAAQCLDRTFRERVLLELSCPGIPAPP